MSHTLVKNIGYLVLLILQATFALSSPDPANFDQYGSGGNKHFSGWSKVTRIFAFGASYTATGFSWKTGVQPSPGNPFGNPSTYKGHTSSNGPNYIMYMTTKYNQSAIQTYDFAWAGSPVPGVVGQVEDAFVPHFTGAGKLDPGWNPARTLFTIFVGVNDLDHWNEGVAHRDDVFKKYTGILDTLYSVDARNFVIYTVGPLDQGPEFKNSQKAKRAAIDNYNGRVATMLQKQSAKYPDANFWKVNMYALFDKVHDNPTQFSQTKGIKDVLNLCDYYAANWMKLPSMDYKHPSCKHAVNEYVWLNGRHVTYPMHDILAKVTVDALSS